MRSYEIQDLKGFTSHLFVKNTFDDFQICEADFVTFASFHINGRNQAGYFDTAEQEVMDSSPFCSWGEIRPFGLSLIRGKRLPLQFRIVLRLHDRHPLCLSDPELQSEAAGQDLFLNIQYRDKKLLCTAGASMSTFTPGIRPGEKWDEAASRFLLSIQSF